MAYQTVPLKVVGATSQNKSQQASNSFTKNWYPEITQDGRAQSALLPWPGTKLFAESPGDNDLDRGMHVFQNILFHVIDNILYQIDSNGAYTNIGTIAGENRCIFDDNGVELVIVAGVGLVYSYNGTTLSTPTETEYNSATSVTMLNNTFIYGANSDNFFVSEAGDALDFRASGAAESRGDALMRPYAFGQWVYMMGEKSLEPFWNAGTDTLGFDRIDSAIVEKGLGGMYTVANSDQFMYFLGDDSNVYQVIQSSIQKISTPSISFQIGKLDAANAVGWTMTLDGQDFYVLNFGSDDLSYAYSEQTGAWFNLSTGVNDGRYIGSSYAKVYGKDIVIDFDTANTLELDDSTYTDNGTVIQRQRVTPVINSSLLGLGVGKRLMMSRVYFALQTGQGLTTGQGSEPAIEIAYSIDGGATFGTIDWPKVGKLGEYVLKIKGDKMVSFYDIQFRLTMSDPVFSSLQDGSVEIKLAGY